MLGTAFESDPFAISTYACCKHACATSSSRLTLNGALYHFQKKCSSDRNLTEATCSFSSLSEVLVACYPGVWTFFLWKQWLNLVAYCFKALWNAQVIQVSVAVNVAMACRRWMYRVIFAWASWNSFVSAACVHLPIQFVLLVQRLFLCSVFLACLAVGPRRGTSQTQGQFPHQRHWR